jgi:PAS domain S-box-containing protein
MTPETERLLGLRHAVSRALTESDTVDQAIDRTLSAISEQIGWPYALFWLRDGLRNLLYVARRHGTPAEPDVAPSITLECGVGVAGQVWLLRVPVWEQHDSTLAIPVATREEFIGAIELVRPNGEPPTDQLRGTLTDVGQQIGHFIAHRRALGAEQVARQLSVSMVASAIDCIVSIDREGRVLEFNPAAERTFGYRRDQVLGKPMVDLIIPHDLRATHRRGMERYLATGKAHILGKSIEVRAQRSDGSVFPIELTIMRVEQPGPPVFTAYLRDLTEQKRLESVQQLLLGASEILSVSLNHEETLRNLSRVVVPAFADWYAVDIVEGNGTLRRLETSHRDPTRIAIAREVAERYPDDPEASHGAPRVIRTGASELLTDISDATLEGNTRDAEHLRLIRQLGLRSSMVVALRANARIVGAITLVSAESDRRYDARDLAVAEDLARRAGDAMEKATLFAQVSEARELLEQQASELEAQADELAQTASELELTVDDLRTANEALRNETEQAEDAREQADEANRAKSDFLASMSHELRTPLNAIMGYAQLLELGIHGTLEERQLEDLRRIDRSAQHLLGLITDILNFAKIEAGRVEFRLERIALVDVLARVEEMIMPQAAAKHLSYDFVNECTDVHVRADEDKLIQIFVNLVSNAVKYTGEGGRIRVECRATADSVTTNVCDTGIGIPPDKIQAVFEPFVQVDRNYAGQRQGTGLGLAISRELARGMGGDLTLRSTVGAGSVFSLRLKREQ